MTVEEVATLAERLGWGYEELMSMTLAERRIWLAASERFDARAPAGARPPAGPGAPPVHAATTPAAVPVSEDSPPAGPPGPGASPPSPAPLRLSTEAERRARLLELLHEEAARYTRR
jgi:hypothetical protein